MSKRIAIIQSSYIPWKGYFDIIGLADEIILLDDVQYTRRDWRNRNRIKTKDGLFWLSVPVRVKGRFRQRMCDTQISEPDWKNRHWQTLKCSYSRAPHFDRYHDLFERLYLDCHESYLSRVNFRFISNLCRLLEIDTPISWSMDHAPSGVKSERLIDLCRKTGATEYLSGPTAKVYLDTAAFSENGVRVSWMDYSGYPEYRQLYSPFDHKVSILDLIFNEGPDAWRFMKYRQERSLSE